MTGPVFPLVGGSAATDLLNTVSWRLDPGQRTDRLAAYADVLAWSRQAGLLHAVEHAALSRQAESTPMPAERELRRFRAHRETAYAALVEGDAAAVERIVARHRTTLARSGLRLTGDHWRWTEPELALTSPRDRATRAVVELLTSPDLAALARCGDAACGWVFLDTSPRRNRRWCIAADCGNRNRARAFYARAKAAR